MDRRHGPFFDADPFFDQNVHDGRQAIGGAGGIGNDSVPRRPRSAMAESTSRPILPKPLMAIFAAILTSCSKRVAVEDARDDRCGVFN